MMTLYIFNPEHDIALASGLSHFTSPRAGRQLRHELSFLPMIWARPGDAVLVDNIDLADRLYRSLGIDREGEWLTPKTIGHCIASQVDNITIKPWGWDAAIVTELRRLGCTEDLLPSDRQIAEIRQISHRQWANEHLLQPLRSIAHTTGQAQPTNRMNDVEQAITQHKTIVLKAPWSSSGRGVRVVSEAYLTTGLRGWVSHIIAQQGCIMIEPLYNKLFDTGMEFTIDEEGEVQYDGVSLFETTNGAYIGNRIGTEEEKNQYLFRYIPQRLWQSVRTMLTELLKKELSHCYRGKLGVDMMVVETDEGYRLHPCVEMNLRTTMGHVALQLHRRLGLRHKYMCINFDGHYHLRIED